MRTKLVAALFSFSLMADAYCNAAELLIEKLVCTQTEDLLADGDEAALYVYVDGSFFNLYTRDMKRGDSWSINERIKFSDNVHVRLQDHDPLANPWDRHDDLGDDHILASSTNRNSLFNQDGALYTLYWRVNSTSTGPTTQPGQGNPPNIGPSTQPGPTATQKNSMKRELEKFLTKHLAKGNEGKATVERFEYDRGAIKFKVKIKHRQVPGGFLGGQPLYSFDTDFEGAFDPRNPASIKNTRICTRLNAYLGGGTVCVTLAQIASALAL